LIHHHTLFTIKPICNKSLLELVDSSLENNGEVKDKQINLLSSVLGDINYCHSDDGQLTGDDVYKLAVVAFKASKESEADTSIVVTNLFKISHELGNVDGSFTYAQLLRIGQGCEPDPAAAAKILTDLSMKAHPYAQFSLAVMYYSGIGIEQDFKKAFTLYKVSSQNLVPQAFSALGWLTL
jgi:TPR repeat protein